MDKKPTRHNEREKPNWDWTHIECYLITLESNRKSTIWNLTPNIILTNPSSQLTGPNIKLYIDTQKSLQYSHELGWNWHKSWNIPNISLRLQIKDQSTGDLLLSPRNLYAQIFAVKKNTQNEKVDRITLIDVGIRGESKMEMIDGQVYFSAIKFSSTTYNNQGIDFNLLIVLYINEGQFDKPKVLTAVISPSIFVDSRRSARDYLQKKFSSFVEPFGYENIEREFIKRENKSKGDSEVLIKNDAEGFYNYITAPNIRHKVKHPVFLAIKFSFCVKIGYNSKLVQGTGINELLQNLQNRLLKESKGKQKNDVELNSNLLQKYFVFIVSNITDSLKRKKVLQSIESMANQYIGIVCGQDEIPDYFIVLDKIDILKNGYKDSYNSLVNICQNYQPEYCSGQSQDEYQNDHYEQSQKSSKKVKKEQNVREPARTSQRNKPSIITDNKIAENDKEEKQKQKPENVLKKEELFQSQFQAPVFLPEQNMQKKNPSVFSKAIGFKNVNNDPIFDTSKLNKAFSNNMVNLEQNEMNRKGNFQTDPNAKNNLYISQLRSNQNLLLGQNSPLDLNLINPSLGKCHHATQNTIINSSISQNQQSNQSLNNPSFNNLGFRNMSDNYNSPIYGNLNYSNIMLSNWLGSVKTNNNSLFQNMMNHSLTDRLMHKNNLQRYFQNEQQLKMMEMNKISLQNEEQQSIVALIQQITLYKELLSQVAYQNQLLSRDFNLKNQNSAINSMNNLTYLNADMPQYSNFGGINFMGNMNGNFNDMNMNNLTGMLGMNNLSNMNLSSMGVPQPLLGNNIIANQMKIDGIMNQNRFVDPQQKQNDINGMTGVAGLNNGANSIGLGFGGNYDLIKNMVLDEIKKQAQQKERDKPDYLK